MVRLVETQQSSAQRDARGRRVKWPKVMKIAAIRETFLDEWIAAEVTKVDKADVPLAGEMLRRFRLTIAVDTGTLVLRPIGRQ